MFRQIWKASQVVRPHLSAAALQRCFEPLALDAADGAQ
eukprot:COSAG04_NODE_29851_length_266_cov_0.622754_2_plen_37_part_01